MWATVPGPNTTNAPRPPAAHRRGSRLIVLATALLVATAGCSLLDRPPPPKEATALVQGAAEPASLAVLPDGSFLFGERAGGRVLRAGADGALDQQPVATVEVAAGPTEGGLIGVAVDDTERVFALYTRASDARLVVAQVAPDEPRTVWEGPEVGAGTHLGGTLLAHNGRLVFAVGDLGDPGAVPDPERPNGKVLQVLPDGPASQRPEVLGSGFVDPSGLTVGPGGDWWVADRSGPGPDGDLPGRIVRIRPGGALEPTALPGDVAPGALVGLAPEELGLCTRTDATMRRVPLDDGRAGAVGYTVVEGCALAALDRPDGSVLITTPDRISVFRPEGADQP